MQWGGWVSQSESKQGVESVWGWGGGCRVGGGVGVGYMGTREQQGRTGMGWERNGGNEGWRRHEETSSGSYSPQGEVKTRDSCARVRVHARWVGWGWGA